MAFTDLNLLKHYKTYKHNIVKEFYTPVLQESVLYQRSVGFFSSTALIELTKGIAGIVKNGGKIQFIVSPYLSEEDVAAIQKGYEKKKIIQKITNFISFNIRNIYFSKSTKSNKPIYFK